MFVGKPLIIKFGHSAICQGHSVCFYKLLLSCKNFFVHSQDHCDLHGADVLFCGPCLSEFRY